MLLDGVVYHVIPVRIYLKPLSLALQPQLLRHHQLAIDTTHNYQAPRESRRSLRRPLSGTSSF